MKLAEALIERADLQRRLTQLKQRLIQNAQYQEGESPAESPAQLLIEYHQTSLALADWVVKINVANHHVTLENGMNMVEALAQRDRLKTEHAALLDLANAAMPTMDRYSHSEIKMLAAMDIQALRKQIDELAKSLRQLDTQIQQANWLTEI